MKNPLQCKETLLIPGSGRSEEGHKLPCLCLRTPWTGGSSGFRPGCKELDMAEVTEHPHTQRGVRMRGELQARRISGRWEMVDSESNEVW